MRISLDRLDDQGSVGHGCGLPRVVDAQVIGDAGDNGRTADQYSTGFGGLGMCPASFFAVPGPRGGGVA
ncbi:hypothetical protein GCM10025787_39720 [Saccharopolyspora rosea]